MTLTFSAKTHQYRWNGQLIPSVTTLLGKGLPKPALPRWASKSVAEYVIDNPDGVETLRAMGRIPAVEALKNVPWENLNRAAIRGTDVHAYAERIVHGETVEVPHLLADHVEGYAHLVDDLGLVPILTEFRGVHLAAQLQYAGTGDLICTVDGETLLLDLKTSKSIYGETACQTAAYSGFHHIWVDGAEKPMPHIDGIGAIHVTEEGSTLHRFPDLDAAWDAWTHIAWVGGHAAEIDDWGMNAWKR